MELFCLFLHNNLLDVVGLHDDCLNEVILMSTYNMHLLCFDDLIKNYLSTIYSYELNLLFLLYPRYTKYIGGI